MNYEGARNSVKRWCPSFALKLSDPRNYFFFVPPTSRIYLPPKRARLIEYNIKGPKYMNKEKRPNQARAQ